MAKNKKIRKVTGKRKKPVERMRVISNLPAANRKYKDTVFRMLFSDKENLLSLYNAINRTAYEDAAELEIVTLESAIYMGMKNDLAFIIDMNLLLYEHQSTYNPNIPLRDLFYISAEYQKLVNKKSLYSSSLQKIPAPYFIVFYNGTEKEEECWENSLSEAYENLTGEPRLELKVITLNINEGHNKELMEQCRTLREYAQYVAKVRKYTKEMSLGAAVERAVNECIQEGILENFLQANRAEVIAMSIFEYNKEEEDKKLRKAEYEAGYDSGYDSGYGTGYDAGKQNGLELGISKGEVKEKQKILQLMLEAGEPVEKIAQYTEYTLEEIKDKIKNSR